MKFLSSVFIHSEVCQLECESTHMDSAPYRYVITAIYESSSIGNSTTVKHTSLKFVTKQQNFG